MKKTIAVLLSLLTVLALFAACEKKDDPAQTELDPNAVLTDSDVPLDVGAQIGQERESEVPGEAL